MVARSDTLAQLLQDIIVPDSVRAFAKRIRVSHTYGKQVLSGHVPSTEILGRIVVAYKLDDVLTQRVFDAAREVRQDIDPETLIHVAYLIGGLPVHERLQGVEQFRAAKGRALDSREAA